MASASALYKIQISLSVFKIFDLGVLSGTPK